ncbi:MAG TPA: metallophosphoesterase family protein [Thermoleophilaceae bacterium]|jgi:predicted phosphodiesterase|nr:metallophosphoesterase family protein [Thermoleophilaceae bacterium]
MRIALLSDVHGNLPAFEAVLADVDEQAVDAVWCLGDLVGYGAQPDGCVELARRRCDLTLAGNHDLVVTGDIPISDFSASAATAARWTQETITAETLEFLKGLRPSDPGREPALFHASPRDPVWEYVLSTWQAEECLETMDARVAAVGHSHVALWFTRDESGKVSGATADAGYEQDLSSGRWLVNPGGVGQPRDGDPRAAWLLLDTDTWIATWRRVEYPIEQAARAIEEAGLPRVLAQRLYNGQ